MHEEEHINFEAKNKIPLTVQKCSSQFRDRKFLMRDTSSLSVFNTRC